MRRLLVLLATSTLSLSLTITPAALAVTEADCTITGTASSETIAGTAGDDVICGLGGNDVIDGGEGNDTIFGGTGADSIDGETGDDRIFGGPGADLLWGGDGSDALAGAEGNDGLTGGVGSDALAGGAGVDYCARDAADTQASSCFRDSAKPKVVALAFNKGRFNTDTENVVRLRATIVDAGTGVLSVGADVWAIQTPYTLSALGGGMCLNQAADVNEACLLSGNRNRGVWELAFRLPAHTPARKFNQLALNLADSASNQSYVEATGALAVSFSTTGSTPDSKSPSLISIESGIPAQIDAQDLTQYEVRLRARDNLSGIQRISGTVRSASCLTTVQMQSKLCQNAISTNDSYWLDFSLTESGDYVGYIQPSPSMFNGQWRLYTLSLRDNVGNTREIWGNGLASFSPPTFKVVGGTKTSISDVQPPLITSVAVSPKHVNTSSAAAIATVTMTVSDNVGVSYVWASVVGPNSYISEPEMSCRQTAGTVKQGTWKCSVRIPTHGATGDWRVVFLARDAANNTADLAPAVAEVSDGVGYLIKNG